MVDQTARSATTEAAKPEAAAVKAPAQPATASAAPKVETAKAAEPVKAEPAKPVPAVVAAKPVAKAARSAAKAKRPVRRAAAKKTEKIVAAPKPTAARKVNSVKKLAVTAAIAAAAAKPVSAGIRKIKGAQTMNKQTREAVDSGLFAADQFRNVFGDVNERAKVAAERSAKIAEEFADLTRGNVEALVASSKIAAKGVETLSQDAAEYSRKAFEEASQALKSFAEVKSATDFFKLQSDFARAAFDNAVSESARLSETALKIAGDIAEPITSRYTVAAERVKTLAA